MNTVLIACQTIQSEIEWVLKHNKCNPDRIYWIRSGLHNVSNSLRDEINSILDELYDVDRVLMGFGACGNALAGVRARDFEMIVPRVDDCISIMLGSYKRKEEIQQEGATYFLTKGWMNGETNIYKEYQFTVEKYGKEMADIVYEDILGQYKNLGIIDTKAYDYQAFLEETKTISEELKLKQLPIEGNLSYLENLLNGPWDSADFIHVKPHEEITLEMFRLS